MTIDTPFEHTHRPIFLCNFREELAHRLRQPACGIDEPATLRGRRFILPPVQQETKNESTYSSYDRSGGINTGSVIQYTCIGNGRHREPT